MKWKNFRYTPNTTTELQFKWHEKERNGDREGVKERQRKIERGNEVFT